MVDGSALGVDGTGERGAAADGLAATAAVTDAGSPPPVDAGGVPALVCAQPARRIESVRTTSRPGRTGTTSGCVGWP
jgi:hypothetical protein